MNFLKPPVEGLWPDVGMDVGQRQVAAQFVDELIDPAWSA